ncbi:hypothetical protein QNH10_12860 [Sporosarcina thermotolerans]|uniref:hypothetical protein n=1 Tax=Sporosarcina thermotolerans TaxID=633404 RepID=UPI0024BC4141|nr:hypothetical protein [Sporosarcina thermotolerans]WHT47148.1 hypothetical protein QNH10_12860 [Sporosarcina thermotolerans]
MEKKSMIFISAFLLVFIVFSSIRLVKVPHANETKNISEELSASDIAKGISRSDRDRYDKNAKAVELYQKIIMYMNEHDQIEYIGAFIDDNQVLNVGLTGKQKKMKKL